MAPDASPSAFNPQLMDEDDVTGTERDGVAGVVGSKAPKTMNSPGPGERREADEVAPTPEADDKKKKESPSKKGKPKMKLKVKYLKYDWTSDAKPNAYKKFDKWSFGAFNR